MMTWSNFLVLSLSVSSSARIAADGAAHAPVVHGDDILLLLDVLADEGVVDGDGAELVLDDGDELTVVALEDVVHQRGLARAQETRHDLLDGERGTAGQRVFVEEHTHACAWIAYG